MTALDMVVIAGGLLFGYRLVSNYLSPNSSGTSRRSERMEPPRESRQDWQHHRERSAPDTPFWFEVLDVPEDADQAMVERAYRQKISQYHPDKVAQMGEDIRQLAEAKSKQINVAYETAMASFRR